MLLHTVFVQDNEEPPALPPRTPEGFELQEEPVYETEPVPEPENDYEDVGEVCEQDNEPEGDYEDVLEPEEPPHPSEPSGEWWAEALPELSHRCGGAWWEVLDRKLSHCGRICLCLPSPCW